MAEGFAKRLLHWYDQHGRNDLPWHSDRTPYRVWVSEIMLQQTQVATVIPYYQKFMARFPDVEALASAPNDDVLQHWSGLGYYARARNLHKAARRVVTDHGGTFPLNQDDLENLPGIGRSTAAAILAQSHGTKATILDGNVKRVLARYHGVRGWPGKTAVLRTLWQWAESHTPEKRVRDYTQAIMDLGAMVCARRKPDCTACPLASDCTAYQRGITAELPERKPRKVLPEKETWLLMIEDGDGNLLMERRPPTGIWGGLWSLPELDAAITLDELPEALERELGLVCDNPEPLNAFRHTFSHYHLYIYPVRLSHHGARQIAESSLYWQPLATASDLGIPSPIRKILTDPRQPSLV